MQRVEHHSEGAIVYIALDPNGEWHHALFPHPLITIDYDEAGNVIGISPVGPRVAPVVRAYADWLADGEGDVADLLERIQREAS